MNLEGFERVKIESKRKRANAKFVSIRHGGKLAIPINIARDLDLGAGWFCEIYRSGSTFALKFSKNEMPGSVYISVAKVMNKTTQKKRIASACVLIPGFLKELGIDDGAKLDYEFKDSTLFVHF